MNNLTPGKYGLTQLECRVLPALVDGYAYTAYCVMSSLKRSQFADVDDSPGYMAVKDALYRLLDLGLVGYLPVIAAGTGWRLTDTGKQMVDVIKATEDGQ